MKVWAFFVPWYPERVPDTLIVKPHPSRTPIRLDPFRAFRHQNSNSGAVLADQRFAVFACRRHTADVLKDPIIVCNARPALPPALLQPRIPT